MAESKKLSLGVEFYAIADKAIRSIDQLETRLKKLNSGFVVSEKAAKGSAKAVDTQRKSTKKAADEMGIYGRQIGKVTGGIQRLTAAMKVTAAYGLAATAIFGVINAFREGIGAIFDFDQALKNLQAITGATDAEIAVLGDRIRHVAATTKYSAREVSDAAILLGQAGFDAAESLDAIQAVAMLATGTLTDMATTADLLTTAIRAFGLKTSESARVADIFASAVNKSKLTIDKLRTAFNYLGPVASNAGLALEETAAATMVLANAGLRGSTIGTGFRQVIARLISPSEKLRLAFRAAGADLEKLNPLANDFSVVLDELSKVITHSGLAIRLFGMRASSAAVALARGSDAYKEMLDYTYRVGVATEMAEKQMEGLVVMAKNLRDKLHELAIALGEGGIASAFRLALTALRPFVALMSKAASTTFGKFIVAVTSLTVVVTALGLAFRYLAIQLSAIAFGYTVAAVKMMAAAKGASLLLVSYTALGVAVKKLWLLLLAHPFVAVTAVIAGAVVLFNTWRDSVKQQTMELHKQSIEIMKSMKSLRGYREQLENVKEGSREHRTIIERLIQQYPQLRSEVDILTTSLRDQIDAVEELIQVELERYLQNQARILAGMSKELDGVTDKLDRWGQSIKEKKYDIFYTAKYVEELKDRQAELKEELKDQVPLWAGIIRQMEGLRGIDFSSSLSQIKDFFSEFVTGLDPATIDKMSQMLVVYFEDAAKTAKDLLESRLTNLEMLLDKEWHAWGTYYQTLGRLDQDRLLDVFDRTEKEITKKRESLKIRYAMELEDAKTRVATEEKIQAILVNIRAKALKKFRDSLDKEKRTYQDFFDKIEQFHHKALGEREQAEIAAAGISHNKRLANFKKAFEAKKDYDDQAKKYEIESENLLQTEIDEIRQKYRDKRLDDEIELHATLLGLQQVGLGLLAQAGIASIEEANLAKLQLEEAFAREVLKKKTEVYEELRKSTNVANEEYLKAVEDKIKAETDLLKVTGKIAKAREKQWEKEHQVANALRKEWGLTWEEIRENGVDAWLDIGDAMASVSSTFATAMTDFITRAKTWEETYKALGEATLRIAIETLIKIGVQQLILMATSKSIMAATMTAQIAANLAALPSALALASAQAAASWGASAAAGAAMFLKSMATMGLFSEGLIAAITAKSTAAATAAASMAAGGEIPGISSSKRADDVIIRATAGEYVQPVDTVEYYGKSVMDAIRERRIPKEQLEGYGLGGFVKRLWKRVKKVATPFTSWWLDPAIEYMEDLLTPKLPEMPEIPDYANKVNDFLDAITAIIDGLTLGATELKKLGIEKWYTKQKETAEELGLSLDKVNRAYDLQIEALEKSVVEGWQDIINDLTLTEYELKKLALDKWYDEQVAAAEVLGLALDDLNYAYELQLQALEELETALDKSIKSIDAMIESLTGGALAPVQSAEYYATKYAKLLATAMEGEVDELLAFIPEYLDFMKGFGMDYAALVASIVAQLKNLKITLPGLQYGGLTSGLSFAGEMGPEWVVPTYEPQRSNFLDDMGMDPDKIGEAIARHLTENDSDKEIHVHNTVKIEVDGHEIGYVVANECRSNVDLIEAVRRVVK